MGSAGQLWLGERPPTEDRIDPVKNGQLPCKPYGGMWTSTYDETLGSSWVQVAYRMGLLKPHSVRSWLLTPRQDARIYIIHTLDDCKALYQDFGYDFVGILAPGSQEVRDLLQRFDLPMALRLGIDFEKLAQSYDAVHLTEVGQQRTRHSRPSMYGWDCESTLWFRWAFDLVDDLGEREFPMK